MVSQASRLAEVQVQGQRRIDAIYAPLALAIADAVMRWSVPDVRGIPRLSLFARFLILSEIGRLLDAVRIPLTLAILDTTRRAENVAQIQTTPIGRDTAANNTARGVIYRALGTDRTSVIGQTGALLARGVAAGAAARTITRTIQQYFSPWFSGYRDKTGALLHTDRVGAITSWPGRAGMASQHARTILLTEATRAHSNTILRLATRDGVGVRYHVSTAHAKSDVCSDNARRDNGYGRGIYRSGDAPKIPIHVNCRCSYSTVPLVER